MIAASDIEDLFKEQLAGIQDSDLRDRTVEVWVEACKAGGWDTVEDVREMPFTILTDAKGINLIEHTIAVTEGAAGLAEAQLDAYDEMPYEVNMDRLIAGALLHDVGKLLEIEQDGQDGYRKSHAGRCARHPISGAILAAKAGLPNEVVNIIACHAKEGDGRPQVIETVFIHQADFATFNPLLMSAKGDLIK